MSGRFACTVEDDDRVVTAHPRGELDLASAARLRTVAHKALAEHPTALIFDLSDLTVADDTFLTVFWAIATYANDEFDAAVLLCAASEQVGAALRTLAIDHRLPICATWQVAVDQARRHERERRVSQRFPPVAGSVGQARALTVNVCARWAIDPRVIERLQVIVTELVANAVQHARTPIDLDLRCSTGFVHVRVHDRDTRPARVRGPASPYAETGRGLLLVDAFAAAWGCRTAADGKFVWATIRRQPLASWPA